MVHRTDRAVAAWANLPAATIPIPIIIIPATTMPTTTAIAIAILDAQYVSCRLDHLMRNPGRVYSREQLLDTVWGRDIYVEARTVDVHIGRLRKALKMPERDDPIRTVRSAGYAFEAVEP